MTLYYVEYRDAIDRVSERIVVAESEQEAMDAVPGSIRVKASMPEVPNVIPEVVEKTEED